MFSNGWIRLWALVTSVLLVILLSYSSYFVWGVDACYHFISISAPGTLSREDQDMVTHLRQEAEARPFCGTDIFSTPLTIEKLAERKVITQVAFHWQEPAGWSFNERDALAFLDGNQITAERIITDTSRYVHKARIRVVRVWIAALIAASMALLLLGMGIAWVRQGFKR